METKVLYKIKKDSGGAQCTECGKWASNPVWIGFEEFGECVESPYGSCCAKKINDENMSAKVKTH